MAEMLRVLSVCTHNQTRSVITAALLGEHLEDCGVAARVLSVGVRGDGAPAMDRAVRLLADRGIDVSAHRSTRLDEPHVRHADLIVCAEHAHVVSISGAHSGAFARTFTLPEVVRLGEQIGPRAGAPIGDWLGRIAVERDEPMTYLEMDGSGVGELGDPTGLSPAAWNTAFAEIDDLTRRLAALLT